MPKAIDQYNRWIGAMLKVADDVAAMRIAFSTSRPTSSGCTGPASPGATTSSAPQEPPSRRITPQVPLAELRARYLDRWVTRRRFAPRST